MGIFNYANGDKYIGSYREGIRHGFGLHMRGGDFYIGQYQDDDSSGLGIFHFSQLNETYLGDWLKGMLHGSG